MTRSQLQWADARELSNKSRPDLPKTFVLHLTNAVCADLGIEKPKSGALIAHQHPLVKKFVDQFTDASAIDDGRPFSQVPGRGLYRIRIEEWRGLIWTDKESGVVWLCRAVSLADFPEESDAYNALAAMGEDIFPEEKERRDAKEHQILVHSLRVLRDAMQDADEMPNSWQHAEMDSPDQGPVTIGRAFVDQIEEDGEVLAERILIAVTKPPAKVPAEEDWIALVAKEVFPLQEGKVDFIDPEHLPDGPAFKRGREVAMAQQTLSYRLDD